MATLNHLKWSPRSDSNRRVLTDPVYKTGAIDHYATRAFVLFIKAKAILSFLQDKSSL